MNLQTILVEKKKVILRKWTDGVLDTYGSPEFFKKQKDRFANPIGATITDGLQNLFDILVAECELDGASKHLENIVKIRAVQEFTPSQAVSFVYLFKTIIREELDKEKAREQFQESLAALEARIDAVALMAFDFYMNCRERLHQIQMNEVLSGRSALTDGTKCYSAMLRRSQAESAEN